MAKGYDRLENPLTMKHYIIIQCCWLFSSNPIQLLHLFLVFRLGILDDIPQ